MILALNLFHLKVFPSVILIATPPYRDLYTHSENKLVRGWRGAPIIHHRWDNFKIINIFTAHCKKKSVWQIADDRAQATVLIAQSLVWLLVMRVECKVPCIRGSLTSFHSLDREGCLTIKSSGMWWCRMWIDCPVRNLCVILSSWKYFKDDEGKDVSVNAMKACGGVELQLRSFLTPTQCNIEMKFQICYPAALHVGKETPVPIKKEAEVQGGVLGWGRMVRPPWAVESIWRQIWRRNEYFKREHWFLTLHIS